MLRRLFLLLVASALILALIVSSGCAQDNAEGTPTVTDAPKVYNLKFQTFLGVTDHELQVPTFVQDVERASNGRIKIEVFYNSELIPDLTAYAEAMREGVIDGAFWAGILSTEEIPEALVEGFPGAWSDYNEFLTIWFPLGFGELMEEAYARASVKYLAPLPSDMEWGLLSTKPINNLGDFMALKVGTVPGPLEMILAELGTSLVQVPFEDVYLALSTGVLDAVMIGDLGAAYAASYHEVANYWYTSDFVRVYLMNILMSLDTFNEMPPDLQQILVDAAWKNHTNCWANVMNKSLTAAQDIQEENADFQILPLPEDIYGTLKAVQAAVFEAVEGLYPDTAEGFAVLQQSAQLWGK